MTTTTDTPTELRLYTDTIDTMPVNKSWDAETWEPSAGDVPGAWNFWEMTTPDEGEEATCNDCGDPIVFADDRWEHKNVTDGLMDEDDAVPADHDAELDVVLWNDEHGQPEGPMMNYWYPLHESGRDFSPEMAARTLAQHNLPLCVVEVDGDYGLALTGGGMDLSWEIAEAFARLGYCPPLHFCNLPRMAGRERYESTPYVLRACAYSARIAAMRAERTVEDIAKMAADYEVTLT